MPSPIPAETTYVAASFLGTVWLLVGQTYVVTRYRAKSGVQYPRLYAEKAEMDANPNAYVFNCIQRAHQNTLEYLPIFFTSTLLTSLKYPILASLLLGTWTVSRVGYTIGYATNRRMNPLSILHYPMLIGLVGSATYTVFQLLWS
ncbi:Membrane-associated proteins in eicosanoid and glutathione metabolism [Mycena chlorophos]|uniref:Membrane-associated proteins in eicosanoid and glutathione metabolism n=1 Tax=Mycena chlorophos TaxID=658473 RepID=A0A8H6TME8_MYCCL|nr:Membrane-associated proteins in eicosanoid and glutathione metabolism [Mycena chlorophos]